MKKTPKTTTTREAPAPLSPVFHHSITVAPGDVDALGHASNVAYVRWIQDAARSHSEGVGCDHAYYLTRGAVFVVRRHEIDYLRPTFAGQTLRVTTWIESYSAATSVRKTEVIRAADDEVVARAATTWALVSLTSSRPQRIDDALRAAFAREPAARESRAEDNGSIKPFLKWAGGKRSLVAQFHDHIPKRYDAYHEPFVGSGALFFHLHPQKRAYLSDSNERLIRTYCGLRDEPQRVIALLESYPHRRDFFLDMRQRDIDAADDAEVAAWFIYLNKTGYNGLYRVNSKNRFNVPFGDYARPRICDHERLLACAERLKGAHIEHLDFAKAARRAKKGDLVYFDPPYVPLSRTSSFQSYTEGGFGLAEHQRLRDLVRELKARGVHVLVSNSSAPTVHELYADGFDRIEIRARRSINSRADARGVIGELLIK